MESNNDIEELLKEYFNFLLNGAECRWPGEDNPEFYLGVRVALCEAHGFLIDRLKRNNICIDVAKHAIKESNKRKPQRNAFAEAIKKEYNK